MRTVRLAALMLVLAVLLGCLASCSPIYYLKQYFEGTAAPTGPAVPSDRPLPEQPAQGAAGELAYTLTQAEIDGMYAQIAACGAIFTGAERAPEELQRIVTELEDAYYHIATQAQLAYIYYCVDQTSSTASDRYLFSSAASSDVYAAYIEMCREIDASESPNRAVFFAEWTEDEMKEMRGFSDEMLTYTKANDEILVKYRALSDRQFYNGSAEYYLQMIQNNNAIARLNGYSSYWDYASSEVYDRSYTDAEMQQMRQRIKTDLVPLVSQLALAFTEEYKALSSYRQLQLNRLLDLNYDEHSENYLADYIATFGGDVQAMLSDMTAEGNSFLVSSEDAYAGAFTAYLYEYERPVCYFGPSYQSLFTVAHEMGHYHGAIEKGDLDIPLDLAEVHSQSNEWLFFAYLENHYADASVMRVLRLYRLYEALMTVVRCALIDEFEERCYETDLMQAEQLDLLMGEVIASYGGVTWLDDMYTYWRYVVLESPVYYLSYAVSMLASLQIYAMVDSQAYQAGQIAYLKILADTAENNDFYTALEAAGLFLPTERSAFEAIELLVDRS